MGALNLVALQGRLTADPELRSTRDGISYCHFRIGVDRNSKEKTADFINISAWRSTAEFVEKYFKKGDAIIIKGELRSDNYTTQDGKKMTSYEVLANDVYFGSSKAESERNRQSNGYAPSKSKGDSSKITGEEADFLEIDEDDDILPFE